MSKNLSGLKEACEETTSCVDFIHAAQETLENILRSPLLWDSFDFMGGFLQKVPFPITEEVVFVIATVPLFVLTCLWRLLSKERLAGWPFIAPIALAGFALASATELASLALISFAMLGFWLMIGRFKISIKDKLSTQKEKREPILSSDAYSKSE